MAKLLEVLNLKKYYPIARGFLFHRIIGEVKAVDGVSFHIQEGETLGLVGESGCGKSTLARTIIRLEEPTSGRILYRDIDTLALDKKGLKWLRKEMQMIFQDPNGCLDPRMRAGDQIGEALLIHGMENEIERDVEGLLARVGLEKSFAERYPHELSGGQKQRIGIARALAVNPKLIIADEAVSSLDISVQAQILNLLMDLKDEYRLSYLFIAHNLAVIRYVSDRIAVMYLGKIVEMADKENLFKNPMHPYTQALLSAVPGSPKRCMLKGEPPSPITPPSGCRFHPRCPEKIKVCTIEEPDMVGKEHFVACHLYQ